MASQNQDTVTSAGAPTRAEPPPGRVIPSSGAPSPFEEGQLVAERYVVIRFIANGGMGEVYEVEDRTLRERVALKTVRPGLAENPGAIERFKREVQLARRVSHPNVCRVHDFGVHRSAGGGELFFLTMELLEGETLARHVARRGRLTPDEAGPIATQIAVALDSAHSAGVLHRDLKATNVMVRAAQLSEIEPRIVVTDFGLARELRADSTETPLSEIGAVVGTPAYMAPEQVEGKPLTAATDIYAFGVLLYEMVTGARPFGGSSPLEMAVRRLTAPAPPPRTVVPDLDPKWEAVILRCLEREPARRYARALDVADALRAPSAAPGDGPATVQVMPPRAAADVEPAQPVVRAGSRISSFWVVAGLTGLVGLALWSPRLRPPATVKAPTAANATPVRPLITATERPIASTGRGEPGPQQASIAVLPLVSLPQHTQSDAVAGITGDMLTEALVKTRRFRVVERTQLDVVFKELNLNRTEYVDAQTAQRIGRLVGAQALLLGTVQAAGAQVRVSARLIHVETGEILGAWATTGAANDAAKLGDALCRDVVAGTAQWIAGQRP